MSNRSDTGESPIEVRRYGDALRRNLLLIVLITVVVAAAAYFVSNSLTKRYEARASIVRQELTDPGQSENVDATTRELNTASILLTTGQVLSVAARAVPGENLESLRKKVRSRVDPGADFLYVTASDSNPERAAAIANAAARTFVARRAALERRQAQRERLELEQELARLRRNDGPAAQIETVRQRISDLGVTIAGAGTELSVAEPATAPTSPVEPHPVRDAALGALLGLFAGVLIVIAREQLVPRVSGPRELSRLLDLPVLVSVPPESRRAQQALSGAEYEAYQALATSIRFTLPPAEAPRTVLVTSAVHGEGKSTVTSHLSRALANAGHRTLVVSADLRRPTVHERLGVPVAPGLDDILVALPGESFASGRALVVDAIRHAGRRENVLDVLPSGSGLVNPTTALADPALDRLFEVIADLDYTYVLIDAPSLLGIADSHALARRCESVLYVEKLDRVTIEKVIDARDVLDRLDRRPIGVVVVGVRGEESPYYVNARPALYEDA